MSSHWQTVSAWTVGHVIGVGVVASLLALAVVGFGATPELVGVVGEQLREGRGWKPVILHVLLSAAIWATLCLIVWRARGRAKSPRRIVRLRQGTAATEFLIVLVPLLLLVSGLAQLAILNTAGLLADVAVYNATRAAWVWEAQGASGGQVRQKAHVAAAVALAPSAPADFAVRGAGAVNDLIVEMGGSPSGGGGASATPESLFYNVAYDTAGFGERKSRKLYFAYHATRVDVRLGDPIQTRMVYQMNVVFPWFAYIWGRNSTIAGRRGYYTPITREYSLPRQQRPRGGGFP